jgi:signal transduction histidine kinase
VRRVAETNGWRVRVSDAPGGGAEFTVEIPCASS